jgi:hypothetical protein
MNFFLAAATLPLVNNTAVPLSALETLFANVVAVILGFGGIALFIMLLLGGIKWITAGGDPKAIEAAQNQITWAIFGVVILALAYLILVFIQNFTGANVTIFKISI